MGRRGGREGRGRVHQEVPAKAQERRTFTSRTNTRTCTYHRFETLPGPQPLHNLQISPFFPILLIPRRLRGFAQLQFRKYAILSSLRDVFLDARLFVRSCEMLRKFDENDRTISMLLSLSNRESWRNHLSRSLHDKSHRIWEQKFPILYLKIMQVR